jgi:hypothetical protein
MFLIKSNAVNTFITVLQKSSMKTTLWKVTPVRDQGELVREKNKN